MLSVIRCRTKEKVQDDRDEFRPTTGHDVIGWSRHAVLGTDGLNVTHQRASKTQCHTLINNTHTRAFIHLERERRAESEMRDDYSKKPDLSRENQRLTGIKVIGKQSKESKVRFFSIILMQEWIRVISKQQHKRLDQYHFVYTAQINFYW